MTQFMGTHQNRLDSKGRVSVPASFRTALRLHAEGGGGIVLRPSHLYACIDACPLPVFERIANPLQRLDLFSETHDDLAVSLFADACTVEPDKEGRVVLPEQLAGHAGLADSVMFIGLGQVFQIWEPAAGLRRVAEGRSRSRTTGATLPGASAGTPAGNPAGTPVMTMSQPASPGHVPVLLAEVLAALAPRDGGSYLDGTFGGGGYAGAILDTARCTLWAIDRDPAAIARGAQLAARHAGLHLLPGSFGAMIDLLAPHGVTALDGVVLDLGVSSFQIDDPQRGFSFRLDGPLDMRMGDAGGKAGPTAADLVNTLPEAELADLIYQFGEERLSRRIARAIAAARIDGPITGTAQLARIIRRVVPAEKSGMDPATRSFQALRIGVNDELGEIERGLAAAASLLRPGGRLVVVSFHSGEDRIVKRFMAQAAGRTPGSSRHDPATLFAHPASAHPSARPASVGFRLLTGRPIRPSEAEVQANPRARSGRLRALERLAVTGSETA